MPVHIFKSKNAINNVIHTPQVEHFQMIRLNVKRHRNFVRYKKEKTG